MTGVKTFSYINGRKNYKMKKTIFTLGLVLASQAAFADEIPMRIQEKWTCGQRSDGTARVSAVVDANSAQATVADFQISASGKHGFYDGLIHELTAQDNGGHDSVAYRIFLVPNNDDGAFSTYGDSEAKKAKGKAVIMQEGFIDCVGDISQVEQVSCKVEFVFAQK
jgi:hypothetical protein